MSTPYTGIQHWSNPTSGQITRYIVNAQYAQLVADNAKDASVRALAFNIACAYTGLSIADGDTVYSQACLCLITQSRRALRGLSPSIAALMDSKLGLAWRGE